MRILLLRILNKITKKKNCHLIRVTKFSQGQVRSIYHSFSFSLFLSFCTSQSRSRKSSSKDDSQEVPSCYIIFHFYNLIKVKKKEVVPLTFLLRLLRYESVMYHIVMGRIRMVFVVAHAHIHAEHRATRLKQQKQKLIIFVSNNFFRLNNI